MIDLAAGNLKVTTDVTIQQWIASDRSIWLWILGIVTVMLVTQFIVSMTFFFNQVALKVQRTLFSSTLNTKFPRLLQLRPKEAHLLLWRPAKAKQVSTSKQVSRNVRRSPQANLSNYWSFNPRFIHYLRLRNWTQCSEKLIPDATSALCGLLYAFSASNKPFTETLKNWGLLLKTKETFSTF